MTREQFAAIVALKPRAVEIDGKTFHLRIMSLAERVAWFGEIGAHDGDGAANQAGLLVRTVCDESGTRLFGDSEEDRAIVTANGAIAIKLADEAMTLNIIERESKDEAVKNSEPGPT